MSQAASLSREETHHGIFVRIGEYMPRLDAARLAYGVKVALAVLIALWIELWFNLGMAGSVVICVLIVASGTLGTTIQKSILRMIGNLIGCSIGLVFLQLFAQDRVGGAVAFSLYSVVCCYFLQRSRYAPAWHWTYDSAALVFFFHIGTATESFTYTAERWLELSIGIMSMTLVSSILWPSRAGKVFERKFLPLLKDLAATVGSLRSALSGSAAPQAPATPAQLAAQISALRSALDTASRDTARYERFRDGYESLIDGLQSLIARATLLNGSFSNLSPTTESPARLAHLGLIAAALDHIKTSIEALADYAHEHFAELPAKPTIPDIREVHATADRIRSELASSDYSMRDAAAVLHVCETITRMANEIERFTETLVHVEEKKEYQPKLSAVRSLDGEHVPFWRRLDVRKSLASGLVIALAFAVWMTTNWPAGPLAVFFAVLVTSKNCTAPYLPPKAMIPGLIVGLFAGSVIYLGVLPKLDGFWQLAAVLFTFCAIGGYLTMSPNPKIAGVAGLTSIIGILIMNLQAHQTFTFSRVVSLSYGLLGGTVLGFIVLSVMWPIVPEKMLTGQIKAVLTSCRRWLGGLSSHEAASPAAKADFARRSARQLGLCVLWSKFLNYDRLPQDSRRTIAKLIDSMQTIVFHLIEAERVLASRRSTPHFTLLAPIAQRLDHRLCTVFDGWVHALEQSRSIVHFPDIESLVDELHGAFDELCDGDEDEASSREAACDVLTMTGLYSALADALGECETQLEELDWKTLNQNYF